MHRRSRESAPAKGCVWARYFRESWAARVWALRPSRQHPFARSPAPKRLRVPWQCVHAPIVLKTHKASSCAMASCTCNPSLEDTWREEAPSYPLWMCHRAQTCPSESLTLPLPASMLAEPPLKVPRSIFCRRRLHVALFQTCPSLKSICRQRSLLQACPSPNSCCRRRCSVPDLSLAQVLLLAALLFCRLVPRSSLSDGGVALLQTCLSDFCGRFHLIAEVSF